MNLLIENVGSSWATNVIVHPLLLVGYAGLPASVEKKAKPCLEKKQAGWKKPKC